METLLAGTEETVKLTDRTDRLFTAGALRETRESVDKATGLLQSAADCIYEGAFLPIFRDDYYRNHNEYKSHHRCLLFLAGGDAQYRFRAVQKRVGGVWPALYRTGVIDPGHRRGSG